MSSNRYLPRRSVPVTVRPTNADSGGSNVFSAESDASSAAGHRHGPRVRCSRNRASDSTSGSSGTVSTPSGRTRPYHARTRSGHRRCAHSTRGTGSTTSWAITVTSRDGVLGTRVVDQHHPHLVAVPAVDESGGVEAGHAVPGRQPAAGQDEARPSDGELDRDAGRDRGPLPRRRSSPPHGRQGRDRRRPDGRTWEGAGPGRSGRHRPRPRRARSSVIDRRA